jgi:hypothetical protein
MDGNAALCLSEMEWSPPQAELSEAPLDCLGKGSELPVSGALELFFYLIQVGN